MGLVHQLILVLIAVITLSICPKLSNTYGNGVGTSVYIGLDYGVKYLVICHVQQIKNRE